MPVLATNILLDAPGLDPMVLAQTYANSSYLAALVMWILVVAAFCADTVGRALKAYRAELWRYAAAQMFSTINRRLRHSVL